MCIRFYSVTLFLFALLAGNTAVYAQGKPIGSWRSHLPYNVAIGVATDGNTVYAISEKGFFSYNAINGELSSYSKVDGMADVGMSQIGYDFSSNTVILGYQSSDIDLYKDHVFYNIPYIRTKPISGAKTINNIYTLNGLAYISTAFGIVVINLDKKEVKDTYVFTKNSQSIAINAFTADSTYFYAATEKGLYRALRTNLNLQDFSNWTGIDTARNYTSVAAVQQQVFTTTKDSLFRLNGTATQFMMHEDSTIYHVDGGKDALYLSSFYIYRFYTIEKKINMSLQVIDTSRFGHAVQLTEFPDNSVWVADSYYGLCNSVNDTDRRYYRPAGPVDASAFDILPNNGEVWVAHGGYSNTFTPSGNFNGVSHYSGGYWDNYRSDNFPPMDGMYDAVDLARDPADGSICVGSMQEGMAVIRDGRTGERYKQGKLEPKIGEPNVYPASSSVFDQNGNLWVTQAAALDELAMRTPDNQWYHFRVTTSFNRPYINGASGIIIDDNNQKWYYAPQGGGVIVYNDNNTPTDPSDDSYRQFTTGVGYGNLPANNAFCLAKDRDGAIWVGTENGIGIISCASVATQGQCDAEQRIVQYDQFAGYLFASQSVKTIAVDGGNRKWVGTTNGVWLITPDADKVLLRFTKDNSPLPSNNIQKIAVDPVTGDVYIGTDQGLVSYRGTATEGGETNSDIVVFPNPVAPGYSGTIAIKGLVTDADVRITDVTGQLIYRTKAAGGMATWNGLDYTGHRPQSGVCLIFVTNKDGTQTRTGKLLFQH